MYFCFSINVVFYFQYRAIKDKIINFSEKNFFPILCIHLEPLNYVNRGCLRTFAVKVDIFTEPFHQHLSIKLDFGTVPVIYYLVEIQQCKYIYCILSRNDKSK